MVDDLDLDGERTLLLRPAAARWLYVFAHGAGAGMHHPFMAELAALLADRDVATLRWEMPYMAAGRRRPDPPAVCEAAVRRVCEAAARRFPELRLVAGGKSMGGRMTLRAQAAAPLPRVEALVFLGFPLHPAGKPGIARAEHLSRVALPMLLVQGERDKLAEAPLLAGVVADLGERATCAIIPGADHGFGVPARAPNRATVMAEVSDRVATWLALPRAAAP
jgi:predicted alpha/beta-hydrolase family hydrolase